MESLIALPPNENAFDISVKGETSAQMWTGKFKCVCVPTLRQRAEAAVSEKQLGRDLLTVDQETMAYHRIISQLSSRLTAAPDWWIASNNGQNLLDLNVVFEVWKKCMEAEKNWKDMVWKDEKKEGNEVKSTDEENAGK